MANARIKTTNKVDLDKKFEERQAKLAGKTVAPVSAEETKGMSKAAKGMILEQRAEESLADQLFGAEEVQTSKISLNTEKEYKDFGKKVSDHLYQGKAPYHVDKFFKELTRVLPEHCDSKQIKSMVDSLQVIYNNKLKKEKEEINGKNMKKKAAALKGGGGKGYDRNNNSAMINDVMGAEDDEYGDYGDEGGFKREEEGEIDFM